jgi:hypothetical protein
VPAPPRDLLGRPLQPLFRRQHFPGAKSLPARAVLAERDQLGRGFHRAHGLGELLGVVGVPVNEARQVVIGERALLPGDGVQRHVRLGDDLLAVAHARALPGGQAHVRLVVRRAGHDQLGGGCAGDGVQHLVLYRGEEGLRPLRLAVVIDAGGVEVSDLLVEPLFRSADLANLLQQFVEIIERAGIAQAALVDDESLDQIAPERRGRPLTKLRAAGRPRSPVDTHSAI